MHKNTTNNAKTNKNGRNTDGRPIRPLMFWSFDEISLKTFRKLNVAASIWTPTRGKIPLQHVTGVVTISSALRTGLNVSYPPHHRWRSFVCPDSSPSPWGTSVWSPPALSARDGLSPGGRPGGSGFAAWGMGSFPQKRCSAASWRERQAMLENYWIFKRVFFYYGQSIDPDLLLWWEINTEHQF